MVSPETGQENDSAHGTPVPVQPDVFAEDDGEDLARPDLAVFPHAAVSVLFDGSLQGGSEARDLRPYLLESCLGFFRRVCHNRCLL